MPSNLAAKTDASEAATTVFLRSQSIPIPQVYVYPATADNPAETEESLWSLSPGKATQHDMKHPDRKLLLS